MKKSISEITNTEDDSSASPRFHDFQRDQSRSAFKKYQDLIIGNRSLLNLLKYETLTFLLMNCPGMLGFFLRQKLYKFLFRNQGKGVAISTGVSLRQPGKISLGDGCTIDEFVRVSVGGKENAEMRIGKNVFVSRGTILNVRDGTMDISDFTSVGSHCRIATMSHIKIGQYVVIAAYCYIGGGNYKTERIDIPMALQGPESRRGVTIGDDVWIGAHTTVSDGVTIGKGSIIGAMSFVNKDIPDYSVAYGCPAKVHKKRQNLDTPENL